MDFRRSGQLDERRRRVLMDEIASPTEDESPDAASDAAGGPSKGPVRAYSPAVLAERQPRVTDLVPTRPLLAVFLVLLGVTGVAAIEVIHIHAAALPLKDGGAQLAALDVRQRGSLATWYSSALLAGATVAALLVFGIRSHRVDDYRGRYRVWLWTAGALAWLSLDAATGLHDALGFAVSMLAGKQVLTGTLAAGCTVTWLAIYGLVLGTLTVRLAIEVWPSLASFAALLVASLLYMISGLMRLEMLVAASPLLSAVVDSTITLLAHVSLAAAIGLFARHVYLDAQGRLKVHIDPDKKRSKSKGRGKLKVAKPDRTEPDNKPSADAPLARPAAAAKSGEGIRFSGASSSSSGPVKSGAGISKGALSSPDYDEDDDEDDDDYGGEKLSKSERRRLKKLARQQQQRRAA